MINPIALLVGKVAPLHHKPAHVSDLSQSHYAQDRKWHRIMPNHATNIYGHATILSVELSSKNMLI